MNRMRRVAPIGLIHLLFTAAEDAFRIILRCDGQPVWDKPLSPFKGSATQSPFVALQTRS